MKSLNIEYANCCRSFIIKFFSNFYDIEKIQGKHLNFNWILALRSEKNY